MSRVMVTGVTGFVGGHVARSLLSRGYEVRALVRPGQTLPWKHEALELREGDLRDRISVVRAMAGCDSVVHVAAHYALWTRDASAVYDANVGGTRNVLDAAVGAGIERIVHTSTVGTVAFRADSDGRLADERDFAGPEMMSGHYKRSKFEAERIARRMAAAGAPIIIVNPTAPVGPIDPKPTPTGKVIVDFMRGAMPAVVDTGLNFVDVRDVADAHVLALERGVPGERYLLGNVQGNLTLREMLERLARITGLRPPRWNIPHGLARVAAQIDGLLEGALLHREPRIPLEGVRMAHRMMWVDPSKAVRVLGMPQRPLDDTLTQAVEWFAANGYAPGYRPPATREAAPMSKHERVP